MNKIIPVLFAATILLAISCNRGRIKYPETSKVDVVDNYFGVDVADPYRWLEDESSPEVAEWVEQQNSVTFDYLNRIPFRSSVRDRLTQLWDHNSKGTPFKEGGKYFFFKKKGLQEQSVLYVQNTLDDEPQVLLDPNLLCDEGTVALGQVSVSRDGQYLAYSISEAGSDWQRIHVRNIETGEDLEDELKWVKFSRIAWYRDGFFYSRYDEPETDTDLSSVNERHKVFYHTLGTPQSTDRLVFHGGPYALRNYTAQVTEDERFIIISETESTHGNSLYIKNLDRDQDFIKLTTSFEYQYNVVGLIGDYLYVHTNYRAPKYKMIRININSLDIGNWRDVIPEKKDVLEACYLSGGKVIAQYIVDAKTNLELYNMEGDIVDQVRISSNASVTAVNSNYNDSVAFFSVSSFIIPSVVYSYNTNQRKAQEYYTPDIDFPFSDYQTTQVFYRSKDGTEVPMFIVHKKGIELDGENPTLLFGYGGFNVSLTPSFDVSRLVWLENGGVFALANIRGGGEYGENWYRAGTKLNKQNVFDDFIAAAEYLIDQNYTSSSKLAINGRSNGGLLVGAVANQRPDLFSVAVPEVGVMDMLRFHKFTIGWAWVNDYGSSEDSIQFLNLYRYSPLHNINSGSRYPAILVTTADHDDRVVPAHSFKYIATLQEKQRKGVAPRLIRVQTRAGHGASTPTSTRIELATDIYSFILFNMDESVVYISNLE